MRIRMLSVAIVVLLGGALSAAEQPRENTLLAWDAYIAGVNATVAERNSGGRPFLWADESAETQRSVRSGDVVVSNRNPRKVPQGLIHDWIGAMFVPNVSLDQVMRVLNGYERYSEIYGPLIRKTSVIERNGDAVELNVVAVQRAFAVTAAVDTDEAIEIVRPGPDRVCITANSLRIQEIADYGQPDEHAFSEARRPGYVWRALIVQRLEQHDDGVYVELETISLSRGIPWEVRWLIKPLTDDLPRRMMTQLLEETRSAVQRSTAG